MNPNTRRPLAWAALALATLMSAACAGPQGQAEPPADPPPIEGETKGQAEAAAKPAPEDPGDAALADALIEAHNRERAKAELPPLKANPKLAAAARVQAVDMAEHAKMSHEGSDGSNPSQRIARQGYKGRATGENVASGANEVPAVIDLWMNSPPHKKNILGEFDEIGVARREAKDGTAYWCVDFGHSWPAVDVAAGADALLEELNRAREEAKLKPLKAEPKLAEVAGNEAKAMVEQAKRGEEIKAGGDLAKQLEAAGYRFRSVQLAVAAYAATPADAAKTWMENKTQKSAILGDFSDAGVGVATTEDGAPYWCLVLARPAR